MTEQTQTTDELRLNGNPPSFKVDPAPPAPEPHQPSMAPMPVQPAVRHKKARVGVPGITGLGFTFALLSLFLLPFYKEAFANYLTYEGAREFFIYYYYYATIGLGSGSALFALLGLILTPVGIHISRRRARDGAALGVAGVLIAIVAIILIAAVTASHVMLYGLLYPY